MRKSAYEKLRDAKKAQESKALSLDSLDDFFAHLLGGPMNPTQKAFIYGQEFCRGYKGPAGCAKTSTLAAKAIGKALLVPGSRIYVSRLNYNDILTTTWVTFQKMLDRLPPGVVVERQKAPPMRIVLRPIVRNDEEEGDKFSTITFMGLTDALGSIEATEWDIDEADEVPEERAREILTRLRAAGDPRDYCACFVFNPPSKTHWLYTACTGRDAQEVDVAKPWMALYEPQARENVNNLPPGYYERMAAHISKEQRARLVDGQWGSTFEGQPVYREFKEHLHVKHGLEWNPHRVTYRCWDFGYNRPAVVFKQLDMFGRLLHLREVIGHHEEAVPFAQRVMAVGQEHFPNADFMDYGDPAVNQHKDTGKTLWALKQIGITMYYRTSKILEGVELTRLRLEKLIDGEPALQYDARGCPVLIDGFKGGYRLDKTGEKPFKDGFYEHVMDADRYGNLNILGGGYTTGDFSNMPASLAVG